MSWLKTASILRRLFVEPSGYCRLCGEKLYTIEDRKAYVKLWKVYTHFKVRHPQVFRYI